MRVFSLLDRWLKRLTAVTVVVFALTSAMPTSAFLLCIHEDNTAALELTASANGHSFGESDHQHEHALGHVHDTCSDLALNDSIGAITIPFDLAVPNGWSPPAERMIAFVVYLQPSPSFTETYRRAFDFARREKPTIVLRT